VARPLVALFHPVLAWFLPMLLVFPRWRPLVGRSTIQTRRQCLASPFMAVFRLVGRHRLVECHHTLVSLALVILAS
jgi:hypothetical protein